jgi:hypothetical protein
MKKVFKPIKERFKMVIFITKIFTFMMKILQMKNRNLKRKIFVLEETVYEQNMIIKSLEDSNGEKILG